MSDNKPVEMSFLDHLEELRWRLIKAFAAIAILGVITFFFKHLLFDGIIFAPMRSDFLTYRAFCSLSYKLNIGDQLCFPDLALNLQSIDMVSQITMHIVASLIAGIIISFPYVFYQLWQFIAPGLKAEERKQARGMTAWVSILFFLGILFGYYMIVPLSVQFLGNYQVSELVEIKPNLNSFVTTVTTLTLATGVLFQLPVVVMILARLGLITPAILKTYRKHAIVVVLILSAIITPPDIASQVLVTLPILVLYEFSILLAARIERKRKKQMKTS
jgi:sec-independent protein translocase protein TatC